MSRDIDDVSITGALTMVRRDAACWIVLTITILTKLPHGTLNILTEVGIHTAVIDAILIRATLNPSAEALAIACWRLAPVREIQTTRTGQFTDARCGRIGAVSLNTNTWARVSLDGIPIGI
jgi:hypothetical protein